MELNTRPNLHVVVGGSADADLRDPWPDDGWSEAAFLHSFVPGRSIADNCRWIARPLFGKPRAAWAECLASELVHRHPEIDRGKQRRGWAAGVLLAVAVEEGLRGKAAVWREVVDDVEHLCGVSSTTALRRLDELIADGLCRPLNPPACRA